MTASRSDAPTAPTLETVWVPTAHNNCGDDAEVVVGHGMAVAPARCRGCGHRFTPVERDMMEAAARAEGRAEG